MRPMSSRSRILIVMLVILCAIAAFTACAGAETIAMPEAKPTKKPTAMPAPIQTPPPIVTSLPIRGAVINEATFPDPDFRAWISKNLDKNSDGKLDEKELKQAKSIDVSAVKTIKSLKGISVFSDLHTLNVSNNKLTELDLSNNTQLRSLTANNDQLLSLDLSKCAKLSELTCTGNIRSVNVKAGRLDVAGLSLTASKMSDVKGAELKDGTLIIEKPGKITYTYDCGRNLKATFTIKAVASPRVAITGVTLSKTSFPYKGTAIKPNMTVKAKAGTKTYTLTSGQYKAVYKNNVKVGGATVTVTGTGFFKGTITKSFKITKVAITSVKVINPSLPWTGRVHKPILTLKAKVNGKVVTLSKTTDYTATYTNNIEPGTATVTVKGKGNFKGTLTATFKINKLKISAAAITLSRTTMKYTGKALKPTVTVKAKVDGKLVTLTKGTDYTVTYTDNIEAGTATVTVKGIGHFTGTQKVTFKIVEQ